MRYITLFFILFSLNAYSQTCIMKKDEFTGKEIRKGSTFLDSRLRSLGPALHFSKVGDDFSIAFTFIADLKPEDFDTGKMLLMIKFNNDEIKKFKTNKNVRIITQHGRVIVAFEGDVSKDDLVYFRTYPIKTIRLCYTGDEGVGYDNSIGEGNSLKIMKSINCVIDTE